MDNKLAVLSVVSVVSLLIFSVSVSALAGKVGESEIVLEASIGESIEKTVRVINDNDLPLDISLFLSDNSDAGISIIDREFTLQPSEEKDARFTIDVKESGRTEGIINVRFRSQEPDIEDVGVSVKIVVTAFGEDNEVGTSPNTNSEDGNSTTESDSNSGKNPKGTAITILSITTLLLIFILMILLKISEKKKPKGSKISN